MLVKEGQKLEVDHSRSGKWFGIATKDFDTEKDEWYSIKLDQDEVRGKWFRGDDMPARNGLCSVKIIEETK